MVARAWLVPYEDATYGRRPLLATIYLTHNNVTGQLVLDVRAESKVVVDGGRARVVVGKGHTIPFSVGSNVGRCSVHPKTTGFEYSCTFGGEQIVEVQRRPVVWLEALQPSHVSVAVQDRVEFRAGKNYYSLVVQADGQEPVVYRKRYSEFAEVHDRMRQAYVGSHLRASLPAPPAKILNPFFDQLEPAFVQNRQVELNDYVKKIITVPRALAMPALLDFLGLQLRAPSSAEPVDLLAPPASVDLLAPPSSVDLLAPPSSVDLLAPPPVAPPAPPVYEEAVV